MIFEILIVLGVASVLIYFTLKKEIEELSLDENCSSIKIKLFTILYFVIFLISIIIYNTREDPYIRPFSYFLALSLMAVFVFAEIIYLPNSKVYRFLIILQIILIPLSFVFTQAFMYGTVLGRDPWLHSYLTNMIMEQGRIPDLDSPYAIVPYLKMPNFHLVVTIFSMMTSLQYKISSLCSIGVTTLLIEILSIYLLGRRLYDEKIALLSAFFVSLSDNVLDMVGKSILPNSIGVAIALFILYLTFTLKSNANIKKPIIILILILFLVATHPLSYFFLIFQSLFFVSIVLFFKKNQHFQSSYTYLISTVVIGISYWMWISESSFEQAVNIFRISVLYGASDDLYMSKQVFPISQVLTARLGMIIYFAISLIGILWMVEKKRKCSHIVIGGIGGAMIGIGVVSFLAPSISGIAHRFWYYGEVVCGIPASIALAILYTRLNRRFKILITGPIIGALVFLMLTASVSNNDNPLAKSYTLRTGLYDSEISAAEFVIFTHHDYPIASDSDYTMNVLSIAKQQEGNLSAKNPDTLRKILDSNGYHFLLRTKILDRCFELGRNPMSLNEDQKKEFIEELNNVKSSLYNNGNVVIY